jgi:hypothetical protein
MNVPGCIKCLNFVEKINMEEQQNTSSLTNSSVVIPKLKLQAVLPPPSLKNEKLYTVKEVYHVPMMIIYSSNQIGAMRR